MHPEVYKKQMHELQEYERHLSTRIPMFPVSRAVREAEERHGRVTAKGSGLEPVDQKWLRLAQDHLNDRQLAIAKAFADAVQLTEEEQHSPHAIVWRDKWVAWRDKFLAGLKLEEREHAVRELRRKSKLRAAIIE